MKTIVILTFSLFLFLSTFSQTNESSGLILVVERDYIDFKKSLIFKPNKLLKIKTIEGLKYASVNYSFTDRSIIIDGKDSIDFEQISWIQGSVYKNADRKILGGLVTMVSIPLIIIPVGEAITLGGIVGYFVSIPFIGMGYGGIKMIGAQKFRRKYDWKINAVHDINK
jgi:hypothetical protein